MIHHSRSVRTDHHVWDGGDLPDWLQLDDYHFDNNQLVIHTPDGDLPVRPGWSILLWEDGEVTVTSPRVVARLWQMEGRCAAVMMNRPHAPHEWEPQPAMPAIHCPGTQDI